MKFTGRFLVLLAVGCGGSKPAAQEPPAQPAAPATVSCTEAVQKALAGASAPDPAFTASVVSLCETDQWSEDSKRCFVDAKTPQDGSKCQTMLTEVQSKNIVDALVQAAKNASGEGSGEAAAPTP